MKQLKKIRKQKQLKQSRLAKLLNITQSTISKWELGKSDPPETIANTVADILGVAVEELYDDDEKINRRRNKPAADAPDGSDVHVITVPPDLVQVVFSLPAGIDYFDISPEGRRILVKVIKSLRRKYPAGRGDTKDRQQCPE